MKVGGGGGGKAQMDIELSLNAKKFNKLDSNPTVFTLRFIDLCKLMLAVHKESGKKRSIMKRVEKIFSYE